MMKKQRVFFVVSTAVLCLIINLAVLPLPCLGQDRYYQFAVDQDRLSGAPDFSFLNNPLTPADRLFVRDGHFYRIGADLKPNTPDDEVVRLFGTNSVFGASFPEEADAIRIAKRLRRLGVNLLRLHHMDSSPDRDPKQARSILTTEPYPTLNTISVRRLRRFLDALKAEGIYINLNLHVGYRFRPDVDHVPAMPEGMSIPTQSKPLHIFYPRMVELQLEFTRKVIEDLNLKDDIVLGMVEIDNEVSLINSWQGGRFEESIAGEYKTELMRQWNEFLKEKYRSTQALRKAWGEVPVGQTLESGGIALVTIQEDRPVQRMNDYILFLVKLDRDYLRKMSDTVKDMTDRYMPIAGTQIVFGGLTILDSHTDMEYHDNHFYIDHYNFPNQRWDSRDWRFRDSSSVGTGLATFLNMAIGREWGKPYTVSEFNQPWPNRQAAELVPTLAAFGAFQDWDALMHFAFSHGREWEKKTPGGFDLNSDWSKYVNFGQSALLFRGAVQPAKQTVQIPVSMDLRLQLTRERRRGSVARGLEETIQFDPQLALQHKVAVVRDDNSSWKPREKATGVLRSDTGELTFDPEAKTFTIQAPGAAGIFGFTGTKNVSAGVIEAELAPESRGFLTLLATALDKRPIRSSERILLTIPGYTLSSQAGSDPPRAQKIIPYGDETDWLTIEPEPNSQKPTGSTGGSEPPAWMERVECFVTIKTSTKEINVYPLDSAGARLERLTSTAVERVNDGFRIHLQADGQIFSPWYEIVSSGL